MTEEDSQKKGKNTMNCLNSWDILFVVYNREKFNELNQGGHEGKIIYSDMHILDDTDTIHDTKDIFMACGFGPTTTDNTHCVSKDKLKHIECKLRKIANISQDAEDDHKFCSQINDKDDVSLSNKDRAWLDFIHSRACKVDDLDDLNHSKQPPEYLDEFLTRIGESPLPKTKPTKLEHAWMWFLEDKIKRVYLYRPKASTVKLYNQELVKNIPGLSATQKQDLMARILGIHLRDVDSKFETPHLYLRVSDLPCACDACLAYDIDKCVSPFRKYMRTRIVRLNQRHVVSEEDSEDGFGGFEEDDM